MKVFALRRLIQLSIVLLSVTVVAYTFVLLSGDPAAVIAGPDAPRSEVERIRRQMGLDRPIVVQYGLYMVRVLKGDFGPSFLYRQPAMQLILERLPASASLAAAALLINFIQSIPIGILSAVRSGRVLDYIGTAYVLIGQSVPIFWSGIIGILVLSVWLRILPSSGYGGWEYFVLPALALGIHTAAYQTRVLRSALLEVMREDYIRTARAKGLTERRVVSRHALKNALVPFVAVTATQFSTLIGGAVIVETVFDWPGLGRLVVQSIYNRDVNMVVTAMVVFATVIVAINYLADLAYAMLDPKIRYG